MEYELINKEIGHKLYKMITYDNAWNVYYMQMIDLLVSMTKEHFHDNVDNEHYDIKSANNICSITITIDEKYYGMLFRFLPSQVYPVRINVVELPERDASKGDVGAMLEFGVSGSAMIFNESKGSSVGELFDQKRKRMVCNYYLALSNALEYARSSEVLKLNPPEIPEDATF